MTAEEQNVLCGLRVDKAELEATEAAIKAAEGLSAFRAVAVSLPVAVDWRNNSGNWTTPIKNQGRCGSCVAFGTAATLEARAKIACKDASIQPDLSEAHLFYCGCGACCGNGWNFPPALDFCKNTGVAKEADFPYVDSNQPCKSGLTPYVKITGWRQVLPVADRKDVLANRGPVVGGMAVYQDFFAYKGGVYKHVSGNLAGYHAISVVGYNDTDKCWICKNSWGPSWGDAGWFRIGYGESGMDTQFAFYDVDLPCPVDNCSKYVPYLTQVLRAARANPQLRTCLLFYVCGMGRRPVCSAAIMAVVSRVALTLKNCPQYRAPFCRALAGL